MDIIPSFIIRRTAEKGKLGMILAEKRIDRLNGFKF